ncbi:MAG: hypothetical protein INH34_12820 [Phycisphaerales bacterium]|jgi:hypothetical protein|nr:hypothetical protein [Phycisphaerales bacterium]
MFARLELPFAAPRSSVARDLAVAAVVGALAYAVSCVVIVPGDVAKGFGIQFQALSTDPPALLGQFPQRVLGPLLAWLCGMGGDGFVSFCRVYAVFLLATVFFFCRRRGAADVDAGLVTLAIALTAAVQLYKDHWVGYPDALGYALFFWSLLAAGRGAPLFWGLYLLNLLNHELAAFLLPWLWVVRRQAGAPWRGDALGAALAVGLYGAWYLYVKAAAPGQVFNASYFADHPLFPGGSVVVWLMALVHLVTTFGPVLAVLAWHQHRREHGRERLHLWLVAGGVFVIFCIAFDWARHSNLVVLPLVLASLRFLAAGHRALYAGLVALGCGLMLWIPPWAPNAWPTDAIANTSVLVETGMIVIKDSDYFPGTLDSALCRWLPRVWPMLMAVLAVGALIWGLGWALARRDGARAG